VKNKWGDPEGVISAEKKLKNPVLKVSKIYEERRK